MNRRKRAAARQAANQSWAVEVERESLEASATAAGEEERRRLGGEPARTAKEAWVRVREAAELAEEAVPGPGLGAMRRAWAAAFLAQLIDLPNRTEEQEREAIGKMIDAVVMLLNLGVYAWKARAAG